MSGSTIEKIAYALEKQDNSWLPLLSAMSTKEILEARYEGEDTILSLLIGATILFPKKNPSIFDALSGICRNVYEKINTRIETPVVGPLLEKMGKLFAPKQGNVPDQEENKKIEESIIKLSATFPHIAEGIRIIAEKFEATRSSYAQDQVLQEEFHGKVEKFLQLENVEYIFGGKDGQFCCKKSCVYIMALQYFFYTSCPKIQVLLLEPLRALFLGFSGYSLDARGARPVHYALSMCGGTLEEEFYGSILSRLLVEEEKRCGSSELQDIDTQDNMGNTLLQYALSSVYCSPKVVYEVVTRFKKASSTAYASEYSTTEMMIANIPYYALFFSLECMNATKKDTLSDANKSLRESMRVGELAGIRQAVARVASENKGIHDAVLNLSSVYDTVLGVVYGIDEKICAASDSALQGKSNRIELITKLLHDYKTLLSNMCADSDIESEERDGFTSMHMGAIFGCYKVNSSIGARDAAKEVVHIMLQNPKYIRKASITAGYAKNARACAEKKKNPGSVNEWVYDVRSIRINRFFATMAMLGQKSSSFLERNLGVLKETEDTIKYCKTNKGICIAGTFIVPIISASLSLVEMIAVIQSALLEPRFKIGLSLVACSLGVISISTAYLCYRYATRKAARDITFMVENFNMYKTNSAKNSADLLECANPYMSVQRAIEYVQPEEAVADVSVCSDSTASARKVRASSLPNLRKDNDVKPLPGDSDMCRTSSMCDFNRDGDDRLSGREVQQGSLRGNVGHVSRTRSRSTCRTSSMRDFNRDGDDRLSGREVQQDRIRLNVGHGSRTRSRSTYHASSVHNLRKDGDDRLYREKTTQGSAHL
ncbi:hypothetical protein [Anaplasma bovis]|uniref:hypothetical protein n=1 Tax=Anaplasma bovis TaxID=186733 RepID=UPI002FF3B898